MANYRNHCKRTLLTMLGGLALLVLCGALAQAAAPEKVDTRITSDSVSYAADKQQVLFTGNVHVKRPDFELWSDTLTVELKAAKTKPAQENSDLPQGLAAGDIHRIIAEGRVRIQREGRTGTSSKAIFTVDDGVFVMTGNPKLTDKENSISGNTIRYFTKENRSEVMGGGTGKQVEAVFSTSGKAKEQGKKP